MKYEDLSFNAINKDGIEVICDILCVVSNEKNSEEPYVIYTDYTMDEHDEFIKQYGKIINVEITDAKSFSLDGKEATN